MRNWDELELRLRSACPTLELRRKEPMARHTTFRLGGPAELMALPKTEAEAAAAVKTARELGVTPFFLGNGSNLLVSDRGYEGFVLKTQGGLNALSSEGETITVGAGVLLAQAATFALEHGLTGLEFAHGIPGTFGGAVTMNAGAYDGEMAQVLTSLRVLKESGEVTELPVSECGLSYRNSAFSDGKRLILSGVLHLKRGDKEAIRGRMEELSRRRREKQPLDLPSAGSTFKRPAGHFAAALIDQCGLKGLTVGGAQVSEKHAGFVVNRGGATCSDVLKLMEEVKARVKAETGVELEPEVKLLGV